MGIREQEDGSVVNNAKVDYVSNNRKGAVCKSVDLDFAKELVIV